MKKKQSTGWAVCDPRGFPWMYAATFLRKAAIQMAEERSGKKWEQLRASGFTVQRVALVVQGKS